MILKLLGYCIVLSLIPCVYLVLRKHAALKTAPQVSGTVVAHILRHGRKGGDVYALKVDYRDSTGVERNFVTSTANNPPSRAVGEHVVVFERAAGKEPDLLVFQDLYLGYWLWFGLGLTVLGCFIIPSLLPVIYLKR